MKYKNASDILPDELLKEIQRYASGEVLYIPADSKRKQWGANSGARIFYEQRNTEIRFQYFNLKKSIEELGDQYNLSEETIRKIIYR